MSGVLRHRRSLRRSRLPIAVGILVVWVAGLGLLARRELLRPMSARMAAAALHVQPSAHYYVIERDGRIIGGASAEVDTTGYGIAFRQHAFGALLGDDDDSITVRARSSYTPTLTFGGFRIDLERGGGLVVLSGQRTEDSLLALSTERMGESRPGRTVSAPDPLFLPASAGLPVVLLDRPRPGARTDVTIFDPLLQRTRTIPLTVARESVFVVVDSAGFDPESRRWRPARSDTLRSWLIISDSTQLSAWVDRSGAIVQLDDGRGTRAVRTAYEIAFENWRLERARSGRTR